jgi:hypothetical protein
MATSRKEVSWEFIRETGKKKYFLVKQTDKEYFVFRTPKSTQEKTSRNHSLENWEGEIVIWGGIPAKVRRWLIRKKVAPDPKKQESLVPRI